MTPRPFQPTPTALFVYRVQDAMWRGQDSPTLKNLGVAGRSQIVRAALDEATKVRTA